MMRYRSFHLGSTEVKNEHLPLRCVGAFGKSYLTDGGPDAYGPDAQQTSWLQGLGAAEVVAQGKEGVTGAGRDCSDISGTLLWLR